MRFSHCNGIGFDFLGCFVALPLLSLSILFAFLEKFSRLANNIKLLIIHYVK